MAAPTVQQVINQTLQRLGLDANTLNPALLAGDNSTPPLSTNDQLIVFLNAAQDEYADTAYLLRKTATAYNIAIGDRSTLCSALTVTGARKMRVAREVIWTPTAGAQIVLQRAGFDKMMGKDNQYPIAANGLLKIWFWSLDDQDYINLYPPPSVTGTITVTGYCYPTLLSVGSLSATIDWMPEDYCLTALSVKAAREIALKLSDDPRYSSLYEDLAKEWLYWCDVMRSKFTPNDVNTFLKPVPGAKQPAR